MVTKNRPAKLIYHGCTRCEGTLALQYDRYGWHYSCITCGYYKEISYQEIPIRNVMVTYREEFPTLPRTPTPRMLYIKSRNKEMYRLRFEEGWLVKHIAEKFNLETDSVFKILKIRKPPPPRITPLALQVRNYEILRLRTTEHWKISDIAKKFGITPDGVHKVLRKFR